MNAQLAPLAPTKPPQQRVDPYAQTWNELKPSQRKKLMQDAGYQAHHHYSHRAWSFIPFAIREDVIAVIKRQKQASTPNHAAHASNLTAVPVRKRYWWEEQEKDGGVNE